MEQHAFGSTRCSHVPIVIQSVVLHTLINLPCRRADSLRCCIAASLQRVNAVGGHAIVTHSLAISKVSASFQLMHSDENEQYRCFVEVSSLLVL